MSCVMGILVELLVRALYISNHGNKHCCVEGIVAAAGYSNLALDDQDGSLGMLCWDASATLGYCA